MKLKTIICLALLLLMVGAVRATNYKKVVGGDISMLNKYMEAGKIYYDANGNTLANTPAFLAYLKAQGLNSMRVRLFVDPSNASSTHKGEGVCQDINYVKTLGKQIKDAGLNFLLDFHYSDTWTDPGQHSTPAAWNSTDPTTLGNYLYNYTVEALTVLKNAGAEPDDIQIGNEVTVGELWPTGKCYADGQSVTTGSVTGTMANFALYLKRSAEACRAVCPNAKIVIHTELSSNGWGAKTLYKTLKNYDVDYDIIGLSYYPYHHGSLSVLESVINSLNTSNPDKKVQIVEVGFYYKWGEGSVDYPVSLEGQKQFTNDLITMLNSHSNVNGLYWWWLESNEYGTNTNVTTNWYAAGLWNVETGKPCPALFSLKNFITEIENVIDIKAYFINESGWNKVYSYANTWYSDDNNTTFTAAWPGSELEADGTQNINGTTYGVYRWDCPMEVTSIRELPMQIQFNNGGWQTGNQSELMGFLNGAYYRYYQSGSDYVSECYKVDIPDGAGLTDHSSDFWCLKWVQPMHVGYLRTFTAGQPATICLPFALTEQEVAAAGKVYKLDALEDGKLIFEPVTYTDAYTPYLFVPKSDGMTFADMGAKVIDVTSMVTVSAGNARMDGVMERTAVASDDDNYVYGYLEGNGKFVKVKSAHVNPFRAYITIDKSAAANFTTLDVVFDEANGIRKVDDKVVRTDNAYTINGTKASDATKGIVVRNGRKYVVK